MDGVKAMEEVAVAVHCSNEIPKLQGRPLFSDQLGNYVRYVVLGALSKQWSHLSLTMLRHKQSRLDIQWRYAGAFQVWHEGQVGSLLDLRRTLKGAFRLKARSWSGQQPGTEQALRLIMLPALGLCMCAGAGIYVTGMLALQAPPAHTVPPSMTAQCPCKSQTVCLQSFCRTVRELITRLRAYLAQNILHHSPPAQLGRTFWARPRTPPMADSSEEMEEVWVDSPSVPPRPPSSAPAGPPPPRPVQMEQAFAHRVARAVARELPGWTGHPNLLRWGANGPREDEGGAMTGPAAEDRQLSYMLSAAIADTLLRRGSPTDDDNTGHPTVIGEALNRSRYAGGGGLIPREHAEEITAELWADGTLAELLGDEAEDNGSTGTMMASGSSEPSTARPSTGNSGSRRGRREDGEMAPPPTPKPKANRKSQPHLLKGPLAEGVALGKWASVKRLSTTKYAEILEWLAEETDKGHPVDVLFLQETCWKQDMEYVATPTNHSHISRMLHVRLHFEAPLDILGIYQYSWNPSKASLEGHKVTAQVKQRQKVWKLTEQWLRTVPKRHGCLIAGDLNTPAVEEPNICGPGVVTQQVQQKDQEAFQDLLRLHRCCLLNTWTGTGLMQRTYIPPGEQGAQTGTQVDFVIARDDLADAIARRACPISTPFEPCSGCRHRPVQKAMADLQKRDNYLQLVAPALEVCAPTDNLDQILQQGHPRDPEDTPSLGTLWKAWATTAKPQAARRRLQLRSEEGRIQSREAEFKQIKDYFMSLFSGPPCTVIMLPEDISFTEEEVKRALGRLVAGKAMPTTSAHAVLWKTAMVQVVPALQQQINHYLTKGTSTLPASFNVSELILLPPKYWERFIAARLQPYAVNYLQAVPQFAYVGGRSLSMALERVASHCAVVRKLLGDQATNLHARRAGRRAAQVCGGVHLSLDISKAYDRVPWSDLVLALREAEVPESLIELILLIHQQAQVRVEHGDCQAHLSLGRGLRQGCGLAPILWTIYSSWLLRRLHKPPLLDITSSNTTYADDFHFGWTIRTGRDMEDAYNSMKHVLKGLRDRGVLVSIEKTVALIELQGPGAAACLSRYLVERPQWKGKFLKFTIHGMTEYVKVVAKHTYLGMIISFKKHDQETAKHRMDLAKGAYSRLAATLKCRDVSVKLRLLLWQGTILPTLLHGLDCTGLPQHEASQMMVMYFKQARAIANSFSMFTHESHQDFARRLRIHTARCSFAQVTRNYNGARLCHMPKTVCHFVGIAITHSRPGQQAFFYHINARSCPALKALYEASSTTTPVPVESEAITEDPEIIKLAGNCSWRDLALHPSVRNKHQHCPECNLWTVKHQYVKRHMLLKHPAQKALIERSEELIVQSDLSITNPCQYCGSPEDAPYKISSSKVMTMEVMEVDAEPVRQMKEATKELELLRALAPQEVTNLPNRSENPGAAEEPLDRAQDSWFGEPQPKYHKDGNKGSEGRGKGGAEKRARDQETYDNSWHSQNSWPSQWRGQWESHAQKGKNKGKGKGKNKRQPYPHHDPWSGEEMPEECKAMINMMANMILRQEAQILIQRQDTAFVVFMQTQMEDSVAKSTYTLAQKWHAMKAKEPEKLSSPMRVLLFQHFIKTVIEKVDRMVSTPSARSTAASLGWMNDEGTQINGVKWDAENRTHTKDTTVKPLATTEVQEALAEILIKCPQDLVVSRYHATRKLASEYQSPTLTMMLEIGNGVEAAQAVWRRLHQLERSGCWVAAGTFLRAETMHRSALGQKLAALTR
ncbi:unnamed protein product [Symbiodinium sp. CCMP2592]|nr:unnamed protein product [Symbiodinium sp. CCMP2592]